jgi:hypothetical protein
MSAFKRGQKADGKFSKPAELNDGRGNANGSGMGEALKSVWSDNNSPAIRGGSENRDKKGT